MGSAFRLPVVRETTPWRACGEWQDEGLRIVATVPSGRRSICTTLDLTQPLVFVMGAEGTGLSEDILEAADLRVRIPMRARVESLNVAVAAALLVYEAARQRQD